MNYDYNVTTVKLGDIESNQGHIGNMVGNFFFFFFFQILPFVSDLSGLTLQHAGKTACSSF